MERVDTSKWQDFRVGDLFDIHPTHAYKLNNAQILDNGDIPVAANSAYNNGIGGYSTKKPTEKGNMVTFSDTVDANTIFYQPDDFIGYPHVQGLYPIGDYADEWGQYTYLFFVSVFRKTALTKGFDYGNKFRRDIAVDLHIKLPATVDGKPDFDYMDSYMREVLKDSEESLERLQRADVSKTVINSDEWKEFSLRDLFDFKLPQGDLQVKQVKDGEIPLITPSAYNNGLLQNVSADSKSTLFPANSLTVDMFGNAYYQEKKYFVTAHGHVNVLLPKITLNRNIGMFIATAIRAMFLAKYGFSDMCTQKVLKKESVKLPVTRDDQPDWDYMDRYMSKVIEDSSGRLRNYGII
nr:restriction endonuclease subunit S [Lachnospiraceae bacterium]